MKKLEHHHKHILKLIAKDIEEDGWTPVSDALYPTLSKNMPRELVEFDGETGGYRARLTSEGQGVIKAMEWL